MDRAALEALGREDLVIEARRFGVKRPEVMTRVELVDEVLRLATPNPVERKEVRGWLGVARDLLASAVERGLNLPDAAAMIRGDIRFVPMHPVQPPVATVTLAEIYGAQGHFDRALGMLDEVLDREADHDVARRLRARLVAERDAKRAKEKEREAPEPVPPMEEDVVAMPRDESTDVTPIDEDTEPATLPPMPDPATLPPAPELATIAPAPGAAFAHTDADEPDHATLMPVRPDVAALGYDELEEETLVPSERAPDTASSRTTDASVAEVPATDLAVSNDAPALDASAPEPAEAAVVFARTGAGMAAVYFELGDLVPTGRDILVLRVVEHRSRAGGVERVERDLPVTEVRGTVTILDLESGSVLRAAIGRKWDGEFRAAAVGAEVHVAPGGADVAWAPRRDVDYVAVAGRSGLTALPAV